MPMRLSAIIRRCLFICGLLIAERSYVGTRIKRCSRGEIVKLLRVAYHVLFAVVSVLREELPSMGRDRGEKPSVVSCPAIKSDNGSEPRICLNPSTIADVCEHVDSTGRNSKISWGQIPVIDLLNGSGDSNGARVIAVTFPQRLRASIKPPQFQIAAKCAPVKVPSSVCQKGIAECSPG